MFIEISRFFRNFSHFSHLSSSPFGEKSFVSRLLGNAWKIEGIRPFFVIYWEIIDNWVWTRAPNIDSDLATHLSAKGIRKQSLKHSKWLFFFDARHVYQEWLIRCLRGDELWKENLRFTSRFWVVKYFKAEID